MMEKKDAVSEMLWCYEKGNIVEFELESSSMESKNLSDRQNHPYLSSQKVTNRRN